MMNSDELAALPAIDVRKIQPSERHATIFDILQALKPRQSFMVISDHEPRPLHYQIQARFPDLFGWNYVQQGPDVWRVVISREEASACECCCGS